MDALSLDLTDAELMVLGAALETDGVCLDDLTLTGADFSDARLGALFDVMLRARLNGQHVTYSTMSDANPGEGVFIMSLMEQGRWKFAVQDHAAIVAKHALRRRLRAAAAGLEDRAGRADLDEQDLIEQARTLVDEAVGERRRPVKFLRDIVPSVITRMESGLGHFVASPWPSLDAVIGGFRPGAVYVIGARPGVGKTVLAQQIAVALAQHGMVAFSSLEMSEEELAARFIAERIFIEVGRVKDNKMTDADWERFAQRRRRVDDLQVAIDDRASVKASDVRQFARSVSRHGKLGGIIVDYVQLLTPENSRADRHVQVTESSRLLKVMAKDLRCPVIVLSQLNRELEKRSDSRPKLADLRESGAIEQDADVVILASREKRIAGHVMTLDVAKNRHGEQADVLLQWQGALSRAIEWEEQS